MTNDHDNDRYTQGTDYRAPAQMVIVIATSHSKLNN